MPLLIRLATADDTDAAQRVSDAAFATVRAIYRPSPQAHANLAAISPTLQRLVAEEDHQIIGSVRYGIQGDRLRVIALAVHPAHHRRGVARSLLADLAQIARDANCRALSLYTITQTHNAPIFQRLGFHLISQHPDTHSISPTGEPLIEAYMEREITGTKRRS